MRVFVLGLVIFFMLACGPGNSQVNQSNQIIPTASATPPTEKTKSTGTECKICDFDFANYKGDLKKEEVDGLFLALNDEYLAGATYGQINQDFRNPRPFINIEEAEARHIVRLKEVFKTYNLPIPENKWSGNVPKFQSVAEACKAGGAAEIANRDLYQRLFETTKREDILIVYRALQRASEENHLPAFERCGQGKGGKGRLF